MNSLHKNCSNDQMTPIDYGILRAALMRLRYKRLLIQGRYIWWTQEFPEIRVKGNSLQEVRDRLDETLIKYPPFLFKIHFPYLNF